MRRVLPIFVLLVSASAAAQTPDARKPSKHLRLPPVEGVERRLPKEFDPAPVLRFDRQADCRSFVLRIAVQTPPARSATPDERYDGCAVIRRETANPSGLAVGARYKYIRAI